MLSTTKYNRNTLLEMLQHRDVTVTFEKLDGTIRVMHATLQANVVPYSSDTITNDNTNTITVWDLDEQDWRSFRMNSVQDIL